MINTENILKERGLRITPIRSKVLELFQDASIALSQQDIENALDSFDRITIYRTLKKFETTGIIHKVLNDTHLVKYAVCKDSCSQHDHIHEHIHFECESCGQTQCIDEVAFPNIEPPVGFQRNSIEILMKGTCNHCN